MTEMIQRAIFIQIYRYNCYDSFERFQAYKWNALGVFLHEIERRVRNDSINL